MKGLVTLALALVTSTAWAHRPQIIDCAEYSQVARVAAEDRESGKSLQDAQGHLNAEYKYANYITSYRALVNDVFTDPALKTEPPAILVQAAVKSCRDWNAEERRTMRLY